MVGSEGSSNSAKNTSRPGQDDHQQYIITPQFPPGEPPSRDGVLELTGEYMCQSCQDAGQSACHIGSKLACLACHDLDRQCLFVRDIRVIGPSSAMSYDVLRGTSMETPRFGIKSFDQGTSELPLPNPLFGNKFSSQGTSESPSRYQGELATSSTTSSPGFIVLSTSLDSRSLPSNTQQPHANSSPSTAAPLEPKQSLTGGEYSRKILKNGQPSSSRKDLRVHRCGQCGNVYTRNEHLQRHARTHLPESKPFTCKHCGEGFARKNSHDNHLLKVHTSQENSRGLSTLSTSASDGPVTSLRALPSSSMLQGNPVATQVYTPPTITSYSFAPMLLPQRTQTTSATTSTDVLPSNLLYNQAMPTTYPERQDYQPSSSYSSSSYSQTTAAAADKSKGKGKGKRRA